MRREREERTSRRISMREKARKRAEQREYRSGGARFNLEGGTKFFQLDPKRKIHRLDIIPYKVTVDNNPEVEKGELWYQRTVFVHYSIGAEEKAYICPKTIGKPCPICENRAVLMKNPDANDEDIEALRPRERELFNVIDLDDEEKGIQLWEISYHAFGKQLEEEIREGQEEWAGFADLTGGYTLLCRFREESIGRNKFLKVNRIDFEERKDYPESILNDAFDLDRILKVLPYDELERVFLGLEEESIKKPQRDDDEENDSEEDEEDSEEPEEDDESEQNQEDEEDSEEEEVDEDEDEEDDSSSSRPKRPTVPTIKPSPKSSKGDKEHKCPAGGKFGKDCDRLEECDDCDFWNDCRETKDNMIRAAKKK